MTEADVRRIVRSEIKAVEAMKNKPKRFVRCGTGSREPKCWGSTIYGPDGCYCGDGP